MGSQGLLVFSIIILSLDTGRSTTEPTQFKCQVPQLGSPLLSDKSSTDFSKGRFNNVSSNTFCQGGYVNINCHPELPEAIVMMIYTEVADCNISNRYSIRLPCQPITVECLYFQNSITYSSDYIHIIKANHHNQKNITCIESEENFAIFDATEESFTRIYWLINGQPASENYSSDGNLTLSIPCTAEFDESEISFIREYRGGEKEVYIAGWMSVQYSPNILEPVGSPNSTQCQDQNKSVNILRNFVIALAVGLAICLLLIAGLLVKAYCDSKTLSLRQNHREKIRVEQSCLRHVVEDYDTSTTPAPGASKGIAKPVLSVRTSEQAPSESTSV